MHLVDLESVSEICMYRHCHPSMTLEQLQDLLRWFEELVGEIAEEMISTSLRFLLQIEEREREELI